MPAIWIDETGMLWILWRERGAFQTVTEDGRVEQRYVLPYHARPVNRAAQRSGAAVAG